MDEEQQTTEKIVIDIDKAIQKALDERTTSISNVVVLVDSAGQRAELQSSNQDMDTLLSKAHDSINKLKGNNGNKPGATYTG